MKITIQELSKAFGGRDILSNFSLEVDSGVRLCVCGPNGTGKSTMLRLLAGVESADGGRVILPRGCRLGFVEQELSEASLETPLLTYVLDVLHDWSDFWTQWEEAAADKDESRLTELMHRQSELESLYGYNPEHRAKAVLSGLGFAEHKWGRTLRELSGGWRERAKLARVLTAGADVLLLDEPTNHLDMEAVEWLESFLLDFKGALVFVAHDRRFMDTVGTHVLYLGLARPVFRKATYTQFLTLQDEYNAQREREARARDLPRNRILREHSLWPLAKSQPDNLVALARIEDMHPRTVRQDGETILKLIREAAALPPEQWPEALPMPLPLEAGALLKQLRAVGQREAERLQIAPELMLRKKSLEALLKSGFPDGPWTLPDNLRGWRRELMGHALLDVLQ